MPQPTLRIATRGSALAIWQASHVSGLINTAVPGLNIEVVVVETQGDKDLETPISELGGKGIFAKEVQLAVLEGRADIAVHSAKDLPAIPIDGLHLAAITERGDPRDALVGATLGSMEPGATVATGSKRRRVQLSAIRPDLNFIDLRGNIASRLSKVPDGGAVVMAAVALRRLQLADHLSEVLSVDEVVPQVGQAALAVECRTEDEPLVNALKLIEDPGSRRCVDAERAFLAELGGDCTLPVGAHGVLLDSIGEGDGSGQGVRLSAILANGETASAHIARARQVGDDPVALGKSVARDLRVAIDG